nr:YncE family protein [Homoserinibacter gongjuensis]
MTPDGSVLYVANMWSDDVSVVDTAANAVTATVPVGSSAFVFPYAVVVSPDGSAAYVANYDEGTVSLIDTASNTETATISVGNIPLSVAISADGARLYVVNLDDGTVSVIDTASVAVTATVAVGGTPNAVAVSPDGAIVYVTNDDGTIAVIDAASNTVAATAPSGASRPRSRCRPTARASSSSTGMTRRSWSWMRRPSQSPRRWTSASRRPPWSSRRTARPCTWRTPTATRSRRCVSSHPRRRMRAPRSSPTRVSTPARPRPVWA